MQSPLKTWHNLFGLLMAKKGITLKEAVEKCKPFNGDQVADAYAKFGFG